MRQVILLRGVNVGSHRRVSMPELRKVLSDAGYGDVRTYVQSGNVVLASDDPPDRLARDVERLIADRLGVEVQVVVRTRDELAKVVERNPLGDVAADPKRYQVAFLDGPPDPKRAAALEGLCGDGERVVVDGREIYAWHPAGARDSKLWRTIAAGQLGATATARNWNTVRKLLEMADE